MLTEQKISWDKAHYLWNDFKLGTEYQQYLFDVYGITVEAGGRVIWNHVFNVIEVIIGGGGAPQQGVIGGKAKKARKKIKLIFIMGDIQNTQTKEVKDISPAVVTDIQNHIQEQIKTKITLSDVQVIKG
jgi:hypothetical protein